MGIVALGARVVVFPSKWGCARAQCVSHNLSICCNQTFTSTDMPSMGAEAPLSSRVPEHLLIDLWVRAQLGNEEAYRDVLEALAGRCRSYLRRRGVAAEQELEDLVQETLVAIHVYRDSHDPLVPVSAWALAICRHKLIDFWRRRGRREAVHDEFDEDLHGVADADAKTEAGATGRDLARLLQGLPPAHRRAIELTKLQGLSVAEAALQIGCSESVVKVHVHRGLQRLMQLAHSAATASEKS